MTDITIKKEKFPSWIFTVYVSYFAGQAVYNTYLNLYLSEIGISTTGIGFMISVSTAVLLVAQTIWGMMSDRAKSKNNVLRFLYVMSALSVLGFYLTKSYLPVFILVIAFGAFFVPIVPLNDNITLEALVTSKWDYGFIRMGGTVGYAVTVLLIGFLLKDSYAPIFIIVAVTMGICLVASFHMPQVEGHMKRTKRTSMKEVLKNSTLTGLILFNLVYCMGNSLFYGFYPIRFQEIGGNSSQIGWMMFACAVAEIPFLMLMHKIVKKIGIRGVLLSAGTITGLRWLLIAGLRSPAAIIGVNLLHGFCYTGITYCIIHFINLKVPKELRASSQVWNATMSTVFSKLIFGYLGGVAFEQLGADSLMIFSAVTMGTATVIFAFWSRSHIQELKM